MRHCSLCMSDKDKDRCKLAKARERSLYYHKICALVQGCCEEVPGSTTGFHIWRHRSVLLLSLLTKVYGLCITPFLQHRKCGHVHAVLIKSRR